MTRFFSTLLLFSLLFTNIHAQTTNDVNLMMLKGAVKSMEERSWTAETNFGKPVKLGRGEDNANYYFNTNGNFTEKEIYAQTGALQVRYQFQYNTAGLLQRLTLFNRGGLQRHYIKYEYNNKRQLTSQAQYLPDGKPVYSYQYQYNAIGKQLGYTWYNASMEKDEVLQNEYDSRGNLVKTLSYNGDNSLATVALFSYDEKNNLLEEKIYSYGADTSVRKTAYTYNDLNQQTTVQAYLEDSTRYTQTIFTYNEEGLVKTEQHVDADNRMLDLYSFMYIYDSHKNWTRKTTYRNGIPILITERELEYFKNR